jgi:hypothetical protein
VALRAWELLRTGLGGIDWAGLPLVAGLLGVQDPESLIWRLQAIRAYRNPTEDTPDGTRNPVD